LQTGIHTFFAILVHAFPDKSTSVSPARSTDPIAPQINSVQKVKIGYMDLITGKHFALEGQHACCCQNENNNKACIVPCLAARHASKMKLRDSNDMGPSSTKGMVALNVGKQLVVLPEFHGWEVVTPMSNVKSLEEAMTWHATLVCLWARCMQQRKWRHKSWRWRT